MRSYLLVVFCHSEVWNLEFSDRIIYNRNLCQKGHINPKKEKELESMASALCKKRKAASGNMVINQWFKQGQLKVGKRSALPTTPGTNRRHEGIGGFENLKY